jgi:6-phosphogluconolactonase/glucosamine-6-phosphate isomerase/deaminase
MNRSLFDFEPAAWLPVRDREVLERCRNIRREEMEITNENGYRIRIVPHPSSAVACEMVNWIWRSDVEDKKTVIIFPNSWKNIYPAVAETCSRYNISARNIHAFCMDEWADENGNVAPITYGPSLGGHFLREFYLNFREDLRPPFAQMHYYTNENITYYSDLIDEVGDGGADLVISATGWIGHTAFIDPGSKAFQAETLEEFMELKAGFVDNRRLTVIQNSGGFGSGDMYHTPRYSVSVGPRDIVHAREHLERHDVGYFGGFTTWERMISRLQLYGPVCKELPASLYQLSKGTIYVSEDMARPIEPTDRIPI